MTTIELYLLAHWKFRTLHCPLLHEIPPVGPERAPCRSRAFDVAELTTTTSDTALIAATPFSPFATTTTPLRNHHAATTAAMAILSAQVRARFREHNQARSNMARQTVVATPKRNAPTKAEAGIMKCRTASGRFHLSQRLKHNEQLPFSNEMDLDPADSLPSPTSDTDMEQSPYEWSNAYSMASNPSSPSPHWTYTTVLPPG